MKNLLVFLPTIMAHQLDKYSLINSSLAFICFSLVASSIYIINDIQDSDYDKRHLTKSKRPIASGKISHLHLYFLISLLALSSVYISLSLPIEFTITLFIYFFLTLAYTFFLKKILYIDLIILTSFYIIRIFAGGYAIEEHVTIWLLLFSFFFFFFLAVIKRITEVQKYNNTQLQQLGKAYRREDVLALYNLTTISYLISLLVLSLYIFYGTELLYSNHVYLLFSVFIFYFWFTRLIDITRRNLMSDDPIIFAITDIPSYFIFILIILNFLISL